MSRQVRSGDGSDRNTGVTAGQAVVDGSAMTDVFKFGESAVMKRMKLLDSNIGKADKTLKSNI